jgi:hypothetical protein
MDGVIGAANWSAMLQKSRQHGVDAGLAARLMASFGLAVTASDGREVDAV